MGWLRPAGRPADPRRVGLCLVTRRRSVLSRWHPCCTLSWSGRRPVPGEVVRHEGEEREGEPGAIPEAPRGEARRDADECRGAAPGGDEPSGERAAAMRWGCGRGLGARVELG